MLFSQIIPPSLSPLESKYFFLKFLLFIFSCAGSLLPGFVLVVSRGSSLVSVRRLLTAVASLVGELGL